MGKYTEPVPRGKAIGGFVTVGVAFAALLVALEVGAIERIGAWWRGEAGGSAGERREFANDLARSSGVEIDAVGKNGSTVLRVISPECEEGFLADAFDLGALMDINAVGFHEMICRTEEGAPAGDHVRVAEAMHEPGWGAEPEPSGADLRSLLAEYMDAETDVSVSSIGPSDTTLRVTSTLCAERDVFDGILEEIRASGAAEELRAAGFIRIECHGGDRVEHSAAP